MHFCKLETEINDVIKLVYINLHKRFLHFLMEHLKFNKCAKFGLTRLRNVQVIRGGLIHHQIFLVHVEKG